MTAPTITYRTGFLDDCTSTTNWIETETGLVASIASNGDIFTITGTCDNAADEYAYYSYPDEGGATNLSLSTNTFPKYTVRWKTSAASNGLEAAILFVFSDATTQTVTLGFNQNWTTTTGTLTASKTLDHIRLIASDNPDTIAAGTFYVYFDCVMIHVGTFTWPFSPASIEVQMNNRYVDLPIPGRIGDITQHLGAPNIIILVRGNVDTSTSWHGTYGFDEEYFYWIMHEIHPNFCSTNAFQWFTSDRISCKVTPRRLRIISDGSTDGTLTYEWELHEYRIIGAENDYYPQRMYDQ